MRNRTLSLRRQELGELTTGELGAVVGAMPVTPGCVAVTDLCPSWDCTGCHITCGC